MTLAFLTRKDGHHMKFGVRKPSIKKSLSARTSIKRQVIHRAGAKMPRGYGAIRNPKKAARNKVYNKTTVSFWGMIKKLFK